MRSKKLKNIIISTITVVALFSSNTYYASALETNEENGNVSENVLNVNLRDNGAVSYGLKGSRASEQNKEFSWDNASVYFAITDRFSNGDTSNDHSYGRSQREADAGNYQNRQGTFHGGDLKGLTNKVSDGYFDKLGVNAIWITAPYEQIHGALCGDGFKHYAYHGYYTLDYTNVDANMGTAKDLENFIDTAHTHGIRVVFDVVMNHAGYADPVTANEYGFGGLSSNWKDIYYNWNESGYKWFNDYAGEAANKGSSGMMQPNGNWVSNWWGPDWIRALGNRFNGYNGSEGGDDKTRCLDGLPDFKTESQKSVSIPGILKTKWSKEGRYDKEVKELNDYFNSTGKSRTVSNHIVKWLTDWVREYGVDGFRCDTAKHVDVSCWKDLKDEAKKALKDWRANNPDKPGAKWTDDFWMTGEHFDHGVYKDNYFTSGAFDSMINFKFKDEGRVFKSSSQIDETFSSYANSINSDDRFNVLSYISSHDKGLSRGNMITAGNNLLLLPGGIQIFYGDETNRQAVGSNTEQSWRSQMNWNNMDSNELSHWQKLGQFRNKHIAVGAGTHKKISSSPYTFSRVYNKNGKNDKVVVALTDTQGNKTISVGNVFSNGEQVRDYYTGKAYTVKDGRVQVNAGKNGVVLLEEVGSPIVIDPSENQTDNLTVHVKYTNRNEAPNLYVYSGDGDSAKLYAGAWPGSKMQKDKDGWYTFSAEDVKSGKVIINGSWGQYPQSGQPGIDVSGDVWILDNKIVPKPDQVQDELIVHVKNNRWYGTPNIYVYTGDGDSANLYAGAWPGSKMHNDGNGWYSYRTDKVSSAKVIFSGSWGQYPQSGQPGMDASGEVWIENNHFTNNPNK